MREDDLIALREQRADAKRALKGNLSEEQRNRLERLVAMINTEVRNADSFAVSWLLTGTRCL